MKGKKRFILVRIFGETVRIKILEILLEFELKQEDYWLNISQMAKLAGISTSSSKRIFDALIEEELVEQHIIETHAKNPEKEIRLNLDKKEIQELLFFYRKIKGFL